MGERLEGVWLYFERAIDDTANLISFERNNGKPLHVREDSQLAYACVVVLPHSSHALATPLQG